MVHLTETKRSTKNPLLDMNHSITNTLTKALNNFTKLCAQLIDVINQNHSIASEDLESFSRFTTFLLRSRITPEADSFERLSKMLTDYWHYKLASEKDTRRSCSYVQLYQMITMIHQNDEDKKSEYLAHTAVETHLHNAEIIKAIKQSPGITLKELQDYSQFTYNDLSKQLMALEEQHFVVARRSGEYRYYHLSFLGEILYRDLCPETNRIWADQWSRERTFVLELLIRNSHKSNKPVLIQDIINIISLLSESQVRSIYTQLSVRCLNLLHVSSYSSSFSFPKTNDMFLKYIKASVEGIEMKSALYEEELYG